MNKIIPFNKDITFNEKIGEIKSIALDDTLKFVDSYTIKGDLIVRGCNKNEDLESDFSYPLPVEIALDNKYNTEKASIMIDDFYYEIINDNILRVKIDLILDDLYYKEEKIEKEVREVVFEPEIINEKEDEKIVEITPIEDDTLKEENKKETKESKDLLDLFQKEDNDVKEYSIYRVYVVSENDTLNSILDKYKVTKEELSEINDLSNFKTGVKLIIPSTDE